MQHFSLLQLVKRIQRSIAINFQEPVWVEGEVAQLKISRGHWYIELVQKDDGPQNVVAQISAVIWKTTASLIEKRASLELEDLIQDGRLILCEANVDFHPIYGLKLIIKNIDVRFTEGLLAKQKAETIAMLLKNGILDKNKSVPIPSVIQRIAVISNENAAGYADFTRQLKENPQGYQFDISLFQAALQGQAAATEIPGQLAIIAQQKGSFDVIVIIRGGGSKMDLSAFDQLDVAQAIGTSPLPVITGIGHETDETVSDMVAAISLKTPTAVAAYLIEHTTRYEYEIVNLYRMIHNSVVGRFQLMDEKLVRHLDRLRSTMHHRIEKESLELKRRFGNMQQQSSGVIHQSLLRLDYLQEFIQAGDPSVLLAKGYSILTYNDKPLTDPEILPNNAELVNKIAKGSIRSIFKDYEPKKER